MGRWGQGFFENDSACDEVKHILARLCVDLEGRLAFADEEKMYPEEALAVGYIVNEVAKIGNEVYCTCDAKLWRAKIEKIFIQFGRIHCDGDEGLDYDAAQEALKLFDELVRNAYNFDEDDCSCGGHTRGWYHAEKEKAQDA